MKLTRLLAIVLVFVMVLSLSPLVVMAKDHLKEPPEMEAGWVLLTRVIKDKDGGVLSDTVYTYNDAGQPIYGDRVNAERKEGVRALALRWDYNEKGLLSCYDDFEIKEDGTEEYYGRVEYTYDDQDRILKEVGTVPNDESDGKKIYNVKDYSYEGNKQTLIWTDIWNMGNELRPYEKTVSTFDANGNVTEIITYSTDQGATEIEWHESEKEDFTYSEDGKQMLVNSMYLWDSVANNWVVYRKVTNKFDSEGRQIEKTDEDGEGGVLSNISKIVTTYLTGNQVANIMEYRNGEEKYRTTYTYDGDTYTEIRETKSGDEWSFSKGSKYEETFDEAGNLLTSKCYTQTEKDGAFSLKESVTNTYKHYHKYENGKCVYCEAADPDYVPPKEEEEEEEDPLSPAVLTCIIVFSILLLLIILYVISYLIWRKKGKGLPFLKVTYKFWDGVFHLDPPCHDAKQAADPKTNEAADTESDKNESV